MKEEKLLNDISEKIASVYFVGYTVLFFSIMRAYCAQCVILNCDFTMFEPSLIFDWL